MKPAFKFGDAVTNIYASEDNPIKHGFFVRRGFNSSFMNHGPYVEYTNGIGIFTRCHPDVLIHRAEFEPKPINALD